MPKHVVVVNLTTQAKQSTTGLVILVISEFDTDNSIVVLVAYEAPDHYCD